MITLLQANQYLDQGLGVALPSFFVQAALTTVATYDAALTAAYPASTVVMIEAMAVALIAAAGAPRRIASQHAPSGASRSFFNDPKAQRDLRAALALLDTKKIILGAVPVIAPTGFFAVVG